MQIKKNNFNNEDKSMEFFSNDDDDDDDKSPGIALPDDVLLPTAPKDIESVLMFRPTFGCSPMGLQAGQAYSFWTIFSSGCIRCNECKSKK